MYYEIYADSLFLLQFILNLYLLELVNHMLYRAMSHKRIIIGAALAAACAMLPFLFPVRLWAAMLCSFCLSLGILAGFTFRAYKREAFGVVLEKMMLSTFLLGGLLLCMVRILPIGRDGVYSPVSIMALVSISFWAARYLLGKKLKEGYLCRVTLKGEKTVTVDALLDTGNSLTEPISGKPAAVLEYTVFEALYEQKKPECFRVLPYHGIDKEGILPGYLLDKIVVEFKGIQKEYKDVYVGVSSDLISAKKSYQMILNPRILE